MTLAGPELQVLTRRLREVQEHWRPGDSSCTAGPVDTAAGSLRRRRLHEWLGVEQASCEPERKRGQPASWTPPLAVLMDAAAQAWREDGGLVVWIGRAIWPYAVSLPGEVAASSVLIDPAGPPQCLWAIDLALRSDAVTAVIADGSGLNLRATRRLQLAAETGRSLAMLARPPHEASQRSAAAYRWLVRTLPAEMHRPSPQERDRPRWEVELFRGKDADSAASGGTWLHQSIRRIVEWHHGEGLVTVPALVVDPAAAPLPAMPAIRRGA